MGGVEGVMEDGHFSTVGGCSPVTISAMFVGTIAERRFCGMELREAGSAVTGRCPVISLRHCRQKWGWRKVLAGAASGWMKPD